MTEEQGKYALAVRDPVLFPTWERMQQQATILHKSGFFPKSIRSSEQALAIMMAGRELNLTPMESLRSIYIVDGQTTISSGLMAAMIWQAGHAYSIDKSTDTECQITFTRSNGQSYTHRFTHEDAKKAGLLGKGNWDKYEKAMLFNRCMSAGSRVFMPDVIRKLYTPEEMDVPVTVSVEGDVVIDGEYQAVEPLQETHWTKDKSRLGKFWAWTRDTKGLTHDQVHEALKVESVSDYTGTPQEAMDKIEAWLDAQMTDADRRDEQEANPTGEEDARELL